MVFQYSPVFHLIQDKIDFKSHFGTNLAPFSLPKSIKIAPKIDLERHRFFDHFLHRFFFDFGSILGAKLEPCWPLFRSKYGWINWGKGLLCRIFVFYWFFGRLGSILAPFWRLWTPSGLNFRRFLVSFWLHFCCEVNWCWMGWWGYAKR